MTAFQAVRARPLVVGGRRRVSAPGRARRRTHPAGLLLAGLLLAFMLGLIYVAQAIQLAATNYEVGRLVGQRDDLARQLQTQETTMLRWRAEPLVVERAQQAGLDPLGARIRMPAR
ncbi:MAG: hypothetical protein M3253_04910 [Chloroflexota bacterium]|nr:hypothetical protein [Chloroflexota bacterium]